MIRIVALGTPNDREKTQWYFQRYVAQLPAAGEMVLFDRSWYNRAGVERVMGFCTDAEYEEFMHACPRFERILQRSGIILIKYWLSVSDDEQERRFQARLDNPPKRWKLSPDRPRGARPLGRLRRGQRRDVRRTDTEKSPWFVVEADDKRSTRLNLISHLLEQIPYQPGRPGTGQAAAAPEAALRAPARIYRETGAGAVSRGVAAGCGSRRGLGSGRAAPPCGPRLRGRAASPGSGRRGGIARTFSARPRPPVPSSASRRRRSAR